jgi:hypothetical protein
MCDYSLRNVRSRPAKVGDKLTNCKFGTGSRGFSAPEDASVAVCLLPGTELSFVEEVAGIRLWPWSKMVKHQTAIFRQVNQSNPRTHHDALEFPDGQIVLLTFMPEGLQATVLQLPAAAIGSRPADAIAPGVSRATTWNKFLRISTPLKAIRPLRFQRHRVLLDALASIAGKAGAQPDRPMSRGRAARREGL